MTTAALDIPTRVAQVAQQLERAGLHFGHGTTNAHDEAAWLVLWSAQLPLDTPLDEATDLSPDQSQALAQLVERRIRERLPTAYLTGEAWLQGVSFAIDPRSIIPRSLIAEVLASGWVDDALGHAPQTVLDMCCGNGSLAILSALAWPHAQVLGVDLSADALAVAQVNGQHHGTQNRIRWQVGDGWQGIAQRFEIILCNPPYVADVRMHALPDEFLAEPDLSLRGGPDGMDFIRPFLHGVAAHLEPQGWLVLEIGHERAGFEAAFPGLEPWWLATSGGEDAVLALSRETLVAWQDGRGQGQP